MSKVLTSLPIGERVGIAFSGGLDTSVAVAWMRDKGAFPCTYTADIGQYDEPDIESVPGRAKQYGAELVPPRRLQGGASSRRGWALACGAFHIRAGGKQYFNTTPLGRAVTGTLLVRRCARTTSTSGATAPPTRATTSSGSTATACSPTRTCGSTSRGSTPTSSGSSAGAPRCPSGSPSATCRTGTASRRRTRPTRTSGARPTRPSAWSTWTTSIEIVEPIMGVRFWDEDVAIAAEDVTVAFDQGRPVAINGRGVRQPGRPGPRGQRHRRAARLRDVRPDREPDHRGQEPRHLRGARAWRCCSSAYERLRHGDPQRGHHRQLPRPRGGAWAGCSTRAAGSTRRRSCCASRLQRWVAYAVTGEVTLRLRRGEDYSIVDTSGPALYLPPGPAVDGAHRGRRVRPARPDRPAHHAQPRHRRLPRQARAVRRAGPADRRPARAHRTRWSRAARRPSPATRPPPTRARSRPSTGRPWSSAPTDFSANRSAAGARAGDVLREWPEDAVIGAA